MVRYIAESEEDFKTVQEPPPVAYLTLLVRGRISQIFPLRDEIEIGREQGNAVVVADHKVSRRHARLTPIDNTFIITDQGSANGTYVNGVLIAQPVRLKNNDRISLGDTVFLFTTKQPDPNTLELASASPAVGPQRQSFDFNPVGNQVGVPGLAGQTVSIWIAMGCLLLIIIALLFIVAVLLGLFVGRSQTIGVSLLWLTWVI